MGTLKRLLQYAEIQTLCAAVFFLATSWIFFTDAVTPSGFRGGVLLALWAAALVVLSCLGWASAGGSGGNEPPRP
ncbi:hypothetical protein [Aestuariirhabdus sp. LZHN29]|uniref:hypothetical protein n=1 Tax=Aestuariirhabdus sp. LZHN29 TaxID=3417462 RepID=UPI003CF3663B